VRSIEFREVAAGERKRRIVRQPGAAVPAAAKLAIRVASFEVRGSSPRETQRGLGMGAERSEHRMVDVGEVRLHVVEAGRAKERPLVVLLHGFPEFWWSWRHQIPALAAAGFHVVVPDMRGFHLSDAPRRVSAYRMDRLESDVAGLIGAMGKSRAMIVGHDWGAMVAWSFAQHFPEMVARLAILNVPHPERTAGALRSLKQLRKSSYILFFQLPWLPEWWLSKGDFKSLRRLFEIDGMGRAEVDRYVEAIEKGGLRGLNYYRAWIRGLALGRIPKPVRIEAQALVIWGKKDRFIGEELAAPDARWVPHARVEYIEHASHWVQHDAPERVNELLLAFATAPGWPAAP
jgi:pimeloyl-ACP methyl ester carboxylesterase